MIHFIAKNVIPQSVKNYGAGGPTRRLHGLVTPLLEQSRINYSCLYFDEEEGSELLRVRFF